MHIIIPINFSYLQQRYRFNENLARQLVATVLPDLTDRLTRDRRVRSVDIFTSEEIMPHTSHSAKIRIIPSNTDSLDRAEDVLLAYKSETNYDSASRPVVVYNPLFPFISVEKLEFGYTSVCEGVSNSAVGGHHTRLGVTNAQELTMIDQGVFTILNLNTLETEGKRLKTPVDVIGLSALELVSLRSNSDYELFGLIKNSGFA